MRSYSTKKIDIAGQRYGRLTALCPAKNQGRKTAWRCRCDCGTELVVRTDHLRTGHITSCGCVGIRDHIMLVDGTCVEMLQKNTIRRNNKSGVPGVDWIKSRAVWRATICFKGKRYFLGNYKNFEDAVKARKQAEHEMIDTFLETIFHKQEKEQPRFEHCVVCGAAAKVPVSLDIAERPAYVAGAGQLCERCCLELYGTHDFRNA